MRYLGSMALLLALVVALALLPQVIRIRRIFCLVPGTKGVWFSRRTICTSQCRYKSIKYYHLVDAQKV